MQQYDYWIPRSAALISTVAKHTVFLDIETTGLKRETSMITHIGCGVYEDAQLHIIQWFNDDAISEETILQAFLAFLRKHPGPLLTFNGDMFDLPFLTAHMEYNELTTPWMLALESRESIDLYKILRGFTKLFSLENGKQKTWESFLGIHREDQYDGGKLIPVYKQYLKTKKESDLHLLLLHNMEDIKGLSDLSVLYAYDQFRTGDYTILSVDEAVLADDQLAIVFQLELKTPVAKTFTAKGRIGYIEFTDRSHCLLTIPVTEGRLYHFYKDIANYVYLPLEDRAVHKSIGAYVDKEHRAKATRKNCYTPHEGIFFPIPGKKSGCGFSVHFQAENVALYQTCYEEKNRYLSFEDLFPENGIGRITKTYLDNIIQRIILETIA